MPEDSISGDSNGAVTASDPAIPDSIQSEPASTTLSSEGVAQSVSGKTVDPMSESNQATHEEQKTDVAFPFAEGLNAPHAGVLEPSPGRRPSHDEVVEKAKAANLDDAMGILINVRSVTSKWIGDPTNLLNPPSRSLESFEFNSDTIQHWTHQIHQHRLVLMHCPDQIVLYSAAHQIAESSLFVSYEKRELMFGRTAKVQEKVGLNDLCHPQIGTPHEPTLILVFADSSDSGSFLQSLPDSPADVTDVHKYLDASRRRILVLTTPAHLRTAGSKRPSYTVIPINALASRLRMKFPDSWQKLEEELRQQFIHGLWGPRDDEEEFCYRIKGLLEENRLEVEISLRNQYIHTAEPAAAFHGRQGGVPVERLQDDTPLENTVAFVGTYFKRLPAGDFERVLLKLLGKQTVERTVSDGSPAVEREHTKLLREIWKERRQTILKSWKLRPTGATPSLIEFDPPEIRDRLTQDFESEFIFMREDMYRSVESAGLLFDQKENVSDAVMRLILRRVKDNPEGTEEDLLPSLVAAINGPAPQQDASPERTREILSALAGPRRHLVLNRIGSLFNLLLQEEYDTVVDHFMKTLLDMGCHAEVLELLPRIGQAEYRNKRIQAVRRILNEGKNELREAAYRLLFQWAAQGGSNGAAILKSVHAWCDGSNAPSCRDSMQLLVHLCQWAITPSTAEEVHPFVSALIAADAETRSALLEWLLSLESGAGEWHTDEWKIGTALLSFLWIIPRPVADDFLTNNLFLCACIQITWSVAFGNALIERLADPPAQNHHHSFLALAVMDCAVALGNDPGMAKDSSALQQMAEVVARMETKKRANILAHCDATVQALNECVAMASEVAGLLSDNRSSILAVKKMKEHWKTISNRVRDFRNRVRQSGAAAKSIQGGI